MQSGSMARMDFSKIKKQFTKIGKSDVRLTQSNLTLIQDINPTKSTYQFPVLENDNATGIKPQEIRLNQNDEMIVTGIGVYLVAQLSSELPIKPSYDNTLNNILLTHNPTYQTRNADNGGALYDGFLRIGVNNINYVDKWDIRKHEKVQRTEWTQAGAISLNGAQLPSFTGEDDAVFPCAPMVTLSGAKKNSIELILPNAIGTYSIAMATNNSAQTIYYNVVAVCIRLVGLLGQNSAAFQGVVPQAVRPSVRR